MKWSEWLDSWSIKSLKVKALFLEMEFTPNEMDKSAAWELYVELITRVITQEMPVGYGDEKTALSSIYILFELTRENLKRNGRHCKEFTKISILVLNQIIRPFTSKWHYLLTANMLDDKKTEFWKELEALQQTISVYSRMLADMAGVEDLTSL